MFDRWIYTYSIVSGDPRRLERRLREQLGDLLAAAMGSERGASSADGSFVLPIPSRVAGVELAKDIRVHVGVAYRTGGRLLLPLSWHADPVRHAFPTFDGTIEMERMDDARVQLTLAGRYRPPMGPAGALMDAVALRFVAERTAEELLRGVAAVLGAGVGRPRSGRGGLRVGQALRVADVMTDDPIVLDESMPVRTAALLLFHNGISGAPVVSDKGELLGVLSERDLLSKEATHRLRPGRRGRREEQRRDARVVSEACTRPARTTASDVVLAEAARVMLEDDLERLVVVGRGRIEGIVTRHDVLAALVRDDTEIEVAVRHAIEEAGEPDVRALVELGDVRLTGETTTRSALARLVAAVQGIDGTIHVEAADLQYREDDLAALISPI